MNITTRHFGRDVKRLRLKAGLTQQDVADIADNGSRTFIAHIEQGIKEWINLEKLYPHLHAIMQEIAKNGRRKVHLSDVSRRRKHHVADVQRQRSPRKNRRVRNSGAADSRRSSTAVPRNNSKKSNGNRTVRTELWTRKVQVVHASN